MLFQPEESCLHSGISLVIFPVITDSLSVVASGSSIKLCWAPHFLFSILLNSFVVSTGFPVAQLVKNLPEMWETWVRSLGWEDPPEKGKAIHSSILAWRIPWTI